jgi:hypothetical protein
MSRPTIKAREGCLLLDASISISRPPGGGEDRVTIEVQDGSSRSVIAHVALNLAEFAAALLGQGLVDCLAEVSPTALAHVGLQRENRDVVLPINAHGFAREREERSWREAVAFALILHERELHDAGWRAYREPAHGPNQHHVVKGDEGGYRVYLERWVDPETGAPVRPVPARWEPIS